jgi:histidyl-tRNA synthetase
MDNRELKAIYGTRDILPGEAKRWAAVMAVVSRVAESYGYDLIMSPIFEATELFSRGIGETNEVVTKEMYSFQDQGGRSLTLRPEGTAPVIRAYIEHSLKSRTGLMKVWYAGPMFRQERPQAGRYRQFHQFGVEAVGSLDPALDAEVISLNLEILSNLGVEDLSLEINSIGMPSDREAHRKAFTNFVKPLLRDFCEDCRRRFEINPLRMFDCKEKSCQGKLLEAPVVFDFLGKENLDHFNEVVRYLELTGVSFAFNNRLVRGLDYYTRTAWEFKSGKLGSQDSVSGGGRYDLLAEQLGGSPTPGVGFAAGIERVLLAMPETEESAVDSMNGLFIAVVGEGFRTEGFRMLQTLRGRGIRSDMDYQGRSLKAQMKQANKSGFRYVIILAEDELARGTVVIRDMLDSSQVELRLEEIYNANDMAEIGELFGRKG